MCAVARDVARNRKKLSPAAAAQEAATELGLAEDDEDVAFAEAQLLALAEVRSSVCMHNGLISKNKIDHNIASDVTRLATHSRIIECFRQQ